VCVRENDPLTGPRLPATTAVNATPHHCTKPSPVASFPLPPRRPLWLLAPLSTGDVGSLAPPLEMSKAHRAGYSFLDGLKLCSAAPAASLEPRLVHRCRPGAPHVPLAAIRAGSTFSWPSLHPISCLVVVPSRKSGNLGPEPEFPDTRFLGFLLFWSNLINFITRIFGKPNNLTRIFRVTRTPSLSYKTNFNLELATPSCPYFLL
jgi:hypothetical protein